MFRIIISLLLIVQATHGDVNCSEEHEYFDDYGHCRQCEKCQAGFEPTEHHCGYGSRESAYACKSCDSGYFSDAYDYNFCRTCSSCSSWKAESRSQCSSTSDTICGECYPNYYRVQKTDGSVDPQCYKCDPDSELAECNRFTNYTPVIIGAVVATLALLFLITCCCWKKMNKTDTRRSKATKKSGLRPIRCQIESETGSSLDPLTAPPDLQQGGYSQQPTLLTTQHPQQYSALPTVEYNSGHPDHQPRTAEVHIVAEDVGSIRAESFDTESVKNLPEKNVKMNKTV